MADFMPVPRDEIYHVINWLRGDLYPNLVGHDLNDEGIAAWVCDNFIRYRQPKHFGGSGFDLGTAKIYLFGDVHLVVKGEYPPTDPRVQDPIPPPGGSDLRPLVGELRIQGGTLVDDHGQIIPRIVHAGDLISRVHRGQLGEIDQIIHGLRQYYHGARMWGFLSWDPATYWRGRELFMHQDWPRAWRDTFEICRRHQFRVALSMGDLWGQGDAHSVIGKVRQFLHDYADVICFLDAGNEAWQTGMGDDPGRGARWLQQLGPNVLAAISSPPDDTVELMRAWSQSPATVRAAHSAFGDDIGCVRRMFNAGYEAIDNDLLPIGLQDEPRGPGRNVSVHRVENPNALRAMCAASLISHQVPYYMSSPGVISDGSRDGHFDGGERFEDMPGFREWSEMIGYFQNHASDIFAWPTVCHGGSRWASRQWFKAVDHEARADQTIASDGRAFCIAHSGRVEHVRGQIEDTIDLGECTLYRGRV